jgi:hypothetical protein
MAERFMRTRYIGLVASAFLICLSSPACAQVVGTLSDAVHFAPVDASALGVTRPASVGISAGNDALIADVGFGVGGGALRGYAGGAAYLWTFGAGYARTLRARDVWNGTRASVGAQLVAGYRHHSYWPNQDGGVGLTIPAAWTIGSPDASSLMLYGGPFVEGGFSTPWLRLDCPPSASCTTVRERASTTAAVGFGAGTRLAIERFSFDFYMPSMHYVTIGLGVRLGR